MARAKQTRPHAYLPAHLKLRHSRESGLTEAKNGPLRAPTSEGARPWAPRAEGWRSPSSRDASQVVAHGIRFPRGRAVIEHLGHQLPSLLRSALKPVH